MLYLYKICSLYYTKDERPEASDILLRIFIIK